RGEASRLRTSRPHAAADRARQRGLSPSARSGRRAVARSDAFLRYRVEDHAPPARRSRARPRGAETRRGCAAGAAHRTRRRRPVDGRGGADRSRPRPRRAGRQRAAPGPARRVALLRRPRHRGDLLASRLLHAHRKAPLGVRARVASQPAEPRIMNDDTTVVLSYFDRLREAFDRRSDLTPEERAAEIARIAAGAPQLADDVRALLEHAARIESPLVSAAIRIADASADALPLPRIPGFHVHRRIGRGGSATVYLADQEHAEFTRTVALKGVERLPRDDSVGSVRDDNS